MHFSRPNLLTKFEMKIVHFNSHLFSLNEFFFHNIFYTFTFLHFSTE